jgi:kynurenine formamidase
MTLATTVAILAGACTAPPPAVAPLATGELVDLSHAYDASTLYWPTSERFRLEKVSEGMTAGGYYYAANNVFTAEHGGTHIDAPIHFAADRPTVDQVPLERLFGPAIVIDVVGQSDADADYQVTTADLLEWESQRGTIPADAIVLIRTGFSSRWPDAVRYLGTSERGAEGVKRLRSSLTGCSSSARFQPSRI